MVTIQFYKELATDLCCCYITQLQER